MLSSLAIRDIVLIDTLDIDFTTGLTVLTGETGAGKSILLDALSLALGGRGDGALVRAGATQGEVVAVFEPEADHPVHDALHVFELGHTMPEGEPLILRRVQNGDGRTRAFVNDSPVSAGTLRSIGQTLVEIHGQHDERAMVSTDGHRALLDAYGRLEGDVASLRQCHSEWRKAERALQNQRDAMKEALREADYLRASAAELSALGAAEGEEEELAEARQIMMHSEKIATDIADAIEELGGSGSPIPGISSLVRRLERKAVQLPGLLDSAVAHIDQALNALGEAQGELETALRQTDFEPRQLELTEERLFALRAASRKFSVPVDRLPELAEKMIAALDDIDSGEEKIAALETATTRALALLQQQAAMLSDKRHHAARALEQAVMDELPALKLDLAQFLVTIDTNPQAIGADGQDQVEFQVQTNPGSRAGPMMKVASGGELSRFLLALKVALADRGSAPTLVFDEIDSGAGGAVADAIGGRLARLANRVQVLCVTHAPQVAARADGHFLISKGSNGSELVATRVEAIRQGRREEEIARMLAGASITDEARAAARKLISQSG